MLLTKSGWSDCCVPPRSLCLLSKWQLNSLDKRSQEGTGLRQSLSRQVISTTTPSLRHLFPETAWQCPLKLFLMQYFGMWSSEGGQAMCQKRGGAVLKRSRHYLSEQSAVFAKKRVISSPKLSTTTLSLYLFSLRLHRFNLSILTFLRGSKLKTRLWLIRNVCQEASHQQTEGEHNNPIFASLGNPFRGCSDYISWGLRKWSKWRQMKFTDSFKM